VIPDCSTIELGKADLVTEAITRDLRSFTHRVLSNAKRQDHYAAMISCIHTAAQLDWSHPSAEIASTAYAHQSRIVHARELAKARQLPSTHTDIRSGCQKVRPLICFRYRVNVKCSRFFQHKQYSASLHSSIHRSGKIQMSE